MVPVNLRSDDDSHGGGNLVGTFLCNLATHLDDPAKRLEAINKSMRDNKKVFAQLPRAQQLALSCFLDRLGRFAPIRVSYLRSRRPSTSYFECARNAGADVFERRPADGNYPLSIPLDGQALNFTLTNNADNLDFGLVGCRRTLPHLQRLLGYLESSLKDLERAVGV